MVMMETVDEMDIDLWETVVSVHSPVVRSTEKGNFYTTYSVSLKSNNSAFSQPYSCVQRRYSEFVHLRDLLKEYHPNIVPPALPPKKLFCRFNQSFISDRTEGLQEFMKNVLNTPVYLSNKGIHLFLQSQSSMAEIVTEISGNVPKLSPTHVCDSCSDTSSEYTDTCCADLEELALELDCDPDKPFDEIGIEAKDLIDDAEDSPVVHRKSITAPIPILQPYLRSSLMKGACHSLTNSLQPSPSGSSTESGLNISRKVSFCDKVKVAVVKDQLWNIGTRPIRSCAW